jgi:hypothetical protein
MDLEGWMLVYKLIMTNLQFNDVLIKTRTRVHIRRTANVT